MKAFIIFLVLAGTCFTACQEEAKKNTDPATAAGQDSASYTRIQWLDSIVNFGSVNMGEQVQVAFRFRNVGNKPLYLTNVKAGCGCTVPDYTKGAVAPGKEGVVTGAFDTNKSHPGEVRKNIFCTTNTPGGLSHTLTFTGVIKEAGAPK